MSLKRLFDILVTASALIVFAVPMAIIALAVKATSAGPAVYWSTRVGRDNQLFLMPKFRTMRIDTPVVATHLLTDPSKHLTEPPRLCRRPQLVRSRVYDKQDDEQILS